MSEDVVTPEVLKRVIDEACQEVEEAFGPESAMFYRAGILDAVALIKKVAEIQNNKALDLYEAFAVKKKPTGGIN